MYRYEVERASLLAAPIVAAAGAKWKGYKLKEADDEPDGVSLAKDPEAAAAALAAAGIVIRDEPSG